MLLAIFSQSTRETISFEEMKISKLSAFKIGKPFSSSTVSTVVQRRERQPEICLEALDWRGWQRGGHKRGCVVQISF